MTGLGAFNARMYLGRTHHQLQRELRVRRAARPGGNKLEHNVDVLRLQCHDSILYSRIANSECRVIAAYPAWPARPGSAAAASRKRTSTRPDTAGRGRSLPCGR